MAIYTNFYLFHHPFLEQKPILMMMWRKEWLSDLVWMIQQRLGLLLIIAILCYRSLIFLNTDLLTT